MQKAAAKFPGLAFIQAQSSSTRSAQYTITISDSSNNEQSPNLGSAIAITFSQGPCYPKSLPAISLTSDLLTRKASDKMKTSLIEYANEHLCGEPMAMEIVEWIRLHFKEYANYENQQEMIPESQGTCVTSLLRLDHMRAKGRYIKTLTSWCEELGIMGRIIFVERLILILLEGHQARVKEFILRLKTQKVDVDSSGKACKEKMMSVLSEKPTDKNRFSSFEVSEMGSVQELRKFKHPSEQPNMACRRNTVRKKKHYFCRERTSNEWMPSSWELFMI
nr:RWD domain-containing protein 3-like [Lytechinus pictus]